MSCNIPGRYCAMAPESRIQEASHGRKEDEDEEGEKARSEKGRQGLEEKESFSQKEVIFLR